MRRDTVNYTLVGMFVLAMGVAFLVMMYSITGRSGATESYFAYYRNVTGLKFGTGVYYEGYRVGQIESIEPEGSGAALRYRVELSVLEDWQIPTDSVANIVSGGLISAMMIEISAGTSAAFLPAGSTLQSAEQANLFIALSRAANEFGDLSRDGLRPLLENLDRRIGQLADEYIALRRENLVPLIETLRANLEQVLGKVDDGATRMQSLLSDENQRLLTESLENFEGATGGLETLVGEIQRTNMELLNAMVELNKLVAENRPGMKVAVEDLQQALEDLVTVTGGLQGRLDNILYHLEGTARNADEFTRVIRENPGALLRSNPPSERGIAP